MKTQPYGMLTQHACLTTPLRNLTLFRFLLTPKFHMTRPLLSSSWEVSCGAQLWFYRSPPLVISQVTPPSKDYPHQRGGRSATVGETAGALEHAKPQQGKFNRLSRGWFVSVGGCHREITCSSNRMADSEALISDVL